MSAALGVFWLACLALGIYYALRLIKEHLKAEEILRLRDMMKPRSYSMECALNYDDECRQANCACACHKEEVKR